MGSTRKPKKVVPRKSLAKAPETAEELPEEQDPALTRDDEGTSASDDLEAQEDPFADDDGEDQDEEAQEVPDVRVFVAEYEVPEHGFTDEFHEDCLNRIQGDAVAAGYRIRGGTHRSGWKHSNSVAVYTVCVRKE